MGAPDEKKMDNTFAVPAVRSADGKIQMSQVPAIMQVLGKRHGRYPSGILNEAKAIQYSLDAADFLSEGFTQSKNKEWFSGDRYKKWCGAVEKMLEASGKAFLTGDSPVYCDFSM